MNKAISFIKESGLLGSLLSSLLISLIGLSLPIIKSVFAFDHTIALQVSLYNAGGFLIVVSSGLFLTYRYVSNTTRVYSSAMGYYRSISRVTYYPYIWRAGHYVTAHTFETEFKITRDGITHIGPLTYYAYRPHTAYGSETIQNYRTAVRVQGSDAVIHVEVNPLGTDGYSFFLRANCPLKSGDRIFYTLDYDIKGQHAMYQEELDWYKALPDIKNTLRNRLIREKNVELISSTPIFASQFDITVRFPDKYPWKLTEELDGMAALTMSARVIGKRQFKKCAKLIVTPNSINLKYRHSFSGGHGHYIFWRLPSRSELEQAGFLEMSNNALH
jgi:hypothetical protein